MANLRERLTSFYYWATLERPLLAILAVLLLVTAGAWYAQDFKLDASADSLVLENDKDLRFYRAVRARYGSDDFLLVTYQPKGGLFADATLSDIRALRDQLAGLERVEKVTTLLDVPLIDSPRMGISDLQKGVRTLESVETDRELARREFRESPLYKSLLTSPDEKITALLVYLRQDGEYLDLLKQRDQYWARQMTAELGVDERRELMMVDARIKQRTPVLQDQLQREIAAVRQVLDDYRDRAQLHLGGVPMIASDMIDFIDRDIDMFGIGVAVFLVVLLGVSFKLPRWILVPMLICFAAAVTMVGYLGLVDWRVTVVSSNFISLMLIITLSLAVHLIVRHQELHAEDPSREQRWMLRETVRSKLVPSLFTSLTTMVAFASLVVSDIRPVMDFGWMMVVGIGLAFVIAFLLFPAALAPLKAGKPVLRQHDATAAITRSLANLIERFSNGTLLAYGLILVLSVIGLGKLTVENRFIDYFKESTEIYQGMVLIDRDLGGTTPLDVVLEADSAFVKMQQEIAAEEARLAEQGAGASPAGDPFLAEFADDAAGLSGESYWYNIFQLDRVQRIHDYLEALPETGKVLSLATTSKMMTLLNNDEPLDNVSLAVIHKRLPADVKETLVDPYMAEDGNQIRFGIRVIDSDVNLQRDALLKKIKRELIEKFELEEGQVKLSGMLVLYNNVLQSLFRSQILTLSVVFLAIMGMFVLLFRSLKLAVIGVMPTVVAAGMILGLMGWLGIPLDIMTITIAAITIGIGVDDTIHYVHRFKEELRVDGDYWAAVKRCHSSVGRAIYYTSVTITLGFSILVLSNFIPTIYFGILTGIAMVVALIANLTLLPLLIVKLKPLGKGVTA